MPWTSSRTPAGVKVRQGLFREPAREGDLPAELARNPRQVHRLRLERVQDVDAHVDQVADDRGDVAARMEHDVEILLVRGVADPAIASRESASPGRRRHDQRLLRTEVVGEHDGIHPAQLAPATDELDLVVDDGVEQASSLRRVLGHVLKAPIPRSWL